MPEISDGDHVDVTFTNCRAMGIDWTAANQLTFDARTNKAGKTKVNLETGAGILDDLGLVAPDLDRLTGR